MKDTHLRWQKLTHGVEDEPAHTEHVNAVAALQDAGDLLHLIPLNVDPSEHGKTDELLFAGAFKLVLGAEHSLVFEEHATCPDSTGEMIDVRAAQTVAAVGSPSLLTIRTASAQTSSKSNLHVNERTALSFIHLR